MRDLAVVWGDGQIAFLRNAQRRDNDLMARILGTQGGMGSAISAEVAAVRVSTEIRHDPGYAQNGADGEYPNREQIGQDP